MAVVVGVDEVDVVLGFALEELVVWWLVVEDEVLDEEDEEDVFS